jgi:hypothetical protein
MTDYETFAKYVKVKSIIHTGSKLYFRLNELCLNEDDLAQRIFEELEQGCFNKDSSAGIDFCNRYRKLVGKGHAFNEFERRLQAEFPTMKERLDDLLAKKNHLLERL